MKLIDIIAEQLASFLKVEPHRAGRRREFTVPKGDRQYFFCQAWGRVETSNNIEIRYGIRDDRNNYKHVIRTELIMYRDVGPAVLMDMKILIDSDFEWIVWNRTKNRQEYFYTRLKHLANRVEFFEVLNNYLSLAKRSIDSVIAFRPKIEGLSRSYGIEPGELAEYLDRYIMSVRAANLMV